MDMVLWPFTYSFLMAHIIPHDMHAVLSSITLSSYGFVRFMLSNSSWLCYYCRVDPKISQWQWHQLNVIGKIELHLKTTKYTKAWTLFILRGMHFNASQFAMTIWQSYKWIATRWWIRSWYKINTFSASLHPLASINHSWDIKPHWSMDSMDWQSKSTL